MKNNLLCFIFFFSSLSGTICQELFAEFPPIQKLDKRPFGENILVVHSDDGGISICYYHSQKFFVYNLDAEGKVVGEATLDFEHYGINSRGVVQTENANLFFFSQGQYITILEAGRNETPSLRVLDFELMGEKDKLIGRLASGNEFYVASWNKKEGNINLARFNKTTYSFDRKQYPIEDDLGGDLARGKSLEIITDATLPEPSMAKEMRKMYLVGNDRVFITLDGRSSARYMTLVVELDWNASEMGQYLLGEVAISTGFASSSNSYIYGDRLSRIWLEPSGLLLEVFDLNKRQTSEPLKSYRFNPSDTLQIMNSPLFVESDNYWIEGKTFSKDNTKKVLNKLAKGIPFVYVEQSGDQLAYTIGNYIERSGGSGFTPGMPGSTIGTPGGVVTLPGSTGYWSYGGSYKTSRYFYSLLDNQTLEHIDGNATEQKVITQGFKKFTDDYLTKGSPLLIDFSNDLANHISLLPGNTQHAVLVSYLKKEGMIKVFKVDFGQMK